MSVSKEDFSIVCNSMNTLQQEKDILEQDKDSLEQKVKDLEEDLTEIVSERNECIDKVDNLLYEKEELEGQVEDLEEKVIRKKDKINTLKEAVGAIKLLKCEYNTRGDKLKKVLEENENLKKTLEDYEHWRDECENLKDEIFNLKEAERFEADLKSGKIPHSCGVKTQEGFKTQEEADLVVETQEELHKFIEENNNCNIVQSEDGLKMFCFKEKVEKLNLGGFGNECSNGEDIIASNKIQNNIVEEESSSEEENEEDLYECLYCGQSGDGDSAGWISERCRKNDEDKVYVDHPECDYKGEVCNGCQWYGEQMCYKCRPLNGEPKSLYYPDTEEEEVEIVELKSKEDINMDKQKKKLASALSRLNSIKKICVSDNGNFQEVQFIMEEHSGKGDLISQKHSENEIRLAKIDKVYQEYQLYLETPHTTSNDFNNALGVYVSKINKILEEQIVNNYSAEELYPNL